MTAPARTPGGSNLLKIGTLASSVAVMLLIALAGCGTGRQNTLDLAQFNGEWEGQFARTLGDNRCPNSARFFAVVRDGIMRGEIRRSTDASVVADRFEAYIELDGALIAIARPGGDEMVIRGQFRGDSFNGEAKSTACTNRVRLSRKTGA